MAGYDIVGARQSGVPDADISAALAPKLNYDLEGARKAGVPENEIADALAQRFNSTPGGAAVGNPTIQRQGDRANRGMPSAGEAAGAIAGAGALGGAMGAFSKEILTGLGTAIGSFPQPAARSVGGFLRGAGQIIGQGGRAAPAAAGAIGGLAGETAGQAVEGIGGGPTAAEAARIVAGGIGPELGNLAAWVARNKGGVPAAIDYLRRATGKEVKLSEAQQRYVDEQITAIRGGAKSDAPLEAVGSIMGNEGDRLMDSADRQLIAALQQSAGVKAPGKGRQMADVGGDLQTTITTRYKGAIDARRAEYEANEKARDAIVSQQEQSGRYVNKIPEFESLIDGIRAQMSGRAPSVQGSYEKILSELVNAEKDVFGQPKPITFQRLDDVRRKLGDAFRGKPAEGYDAIGEAAAKDLYGKVAEVQKKFAGQSQEKLLDDYAARTEGMEKFSSKYGKKTTALDQYREDQFVNDPSTLPSTYFKTRASVQALKELTGNTAQVNNAALEFANRELAGKDAAGVRKWMGSNAEWLAETPVAQKLVDKYASKLEVAERSSRNAAEFASQAAKDSALLTRQALPAQRAVDLIKSGDTELWGKVLPAIQNSPQAKTQMVNAMRQVVADMASAKTTADLFTRNIRPFLEGSGIAQKAEMDFIAQRLANIQALNVPEAEKLGIAKRMILQASGAWAASAASRGGVNAFQWSREQMVPQ